MTEANVWQPRKILDISKEVKSVGQRFVATGGQATFLIEDFVYAVNTASLEVYKNGKFLDTDVDFIELTPTSFVLTSNCAEGDIISTTATVDVTVGDISDVEQAVIDSAESANASQLTAWESAASALTAESFASEPIGVPVKIYTSAGEGNFNSVDTDPVVYSALHYAGTVGDLLNDDTPQLGGDLDLNGFDIPVSPAVAAVLATKIGAENATLTGDPTAPTAAPGDNDFSIANTAFVTAALALKANKNNAVLTGSPTTPTPSTSNNGTRLASTAFVRAAITAYAPGGGDPGAPATWSSIGAVILAKHSAVTVSLAPGATVSGANLNPTSLTDEGGSISAGVAAGTISGTWRYQGSHSGLTITERPISVWQRIS